MIILPSYVYQTTSYILDINVIFKSIYTAAVYWKITNDIYINFQGWPSYYVTLLHL